MTKKFTEEEYQKIADCFDELNKKYNMGLLSSGLVNEFFKKLIRDYEYRLYWQEIVAIMNPITRNQAHDKFVEKEKKYYWKSKKTDKEGLFKTIIEHTLGYPTDSYYINANPGAFTETQIREWGYNPDMFDKEEVE